MALSLHIVCSMERMELVYRGVRESEYHSRLIVVMVHMLFIARQSGGFARGGYCSQCDTVLDNYDPEGDLCRSCDGAAVEDAVAAEEQSVEDGQARWSETGNTRRC